MTYTDDQATLGDRIVAAREARDQSQTQLAQRLGVRARTLRDWENDRAEPRANRMQMLAAMLGVSLRWLMTGEGEDPKGPDLTDPMPTVSAGVLAELRSLRLAHLAMAERLERLETSLRQPEHALSQHPFPDATDA